MCPQIELTDPGSAVDDRDMVISAADTVALSTMFTDATLFRHSEGSRRTDMVVAVLTIT